MIIFRFIFAAVRTLAPGFESILSNTIKKITPIRACFLLWRRRRDFLARHKCPSLGAILIPAHNIEFFTEDGKLRVRITDFSNQTYELKVSCKYLRDIFDQDKDVVGLNSTVAVSQYAHCRIGLARKFLMQENHCYLMLNGLFLY